MNHTINTDLPLVSISVITYNSSKYVLETLESAKAQTYQNIELIVSDDCSTDSTVEICTKWIEENKSRFVRAELITVPANTGIPANCNRGVKAANGVWIKLIAGDDALLDNCLTSNINYSASNREIAVIQSNCEYYNEFLNSVSYIGTSNLNKNSFNKSSITPREQYKLLLIKNRVIGPSIFLKRKTLIEIGGFDENLHLINDLPLWINLTKNNIKIYYLDEITVKYRKTDNSVTKNKRPNMDSTYAKEKLLFYKIYIKKNISLYNGFRYRNGLKIIILLNVIRLNRNNYLSRSLFKIADKFMMG